MIDILVIIVLICIVVLLMTSIACGVMFLKNMIDEDRDDF